MWDQDAEALRRKRPLQWRFDAPPCWAIVVFDQRLFSEICFELKLDSWKSRDYSDSVTALDLGNFFKRNFNISV